MMEQQTEKLRNAVRDLHEALESTQNMSPEVRGLLEGALDDVRAVLQKKTPGSATAPSGVTRSRLSEAALSFEGTHPTLAGTVQSVIDALAQMGI